MAQYNRERQTMNILFGLVGGVLLAVVFYLVYTGVGVPKTTPPTPTITSMPTYTQTTKPTSTQTDIPIDEPFSTLTSPPATSTEYYPLFTETPRTKNKPKNSETAVAPGPAPTKTPPTPPKPPNPTSPPPPPRP